MNFKDYVATVPNFPKKGIMFRDITPLINDGKAFKACIDEIANYAKAKGATLILGPEARGFIFGCPVAYKLGIGFSPVRKPGKLPREYVSASYSLEYGSNELCLLKDSVKKGDKVVVVDDLLATGGTAKAVCELVELLGGEVVGIACPIELPGLKGREVLADYDVFSLMSFEGE